MDAWQESRRFARNLAGLFGVILSVVFPRRQGSDSSCGHQITTKQSSQGS